ncbi:MAG: hypothetical protein U0X39_13860 [Bacteroidales bacterium]
MKKVFILLFMLLLCSKVSLAQKPGGIGLRLGPAFILEEPKPGLALDLDMKPAGLPLSFSPFIEYFTGAGVSKMHAGLDIQLCKSIQKGFYIGVGGGLSRWANSENARISPNIHPLIGYRLKITELISVFGEAKFNFNTKTNPDTDEFNAAMEFFSHHGYFDNPEIVAGPLFDRDFSGSIGICINFIKSK